MKKLKHYTITGKNVGTGFVHEWTQGLGLPHDRWGGGPVPGIRLASVFWFVKMGIITGPSSLG